MRLFFERYTLVSFAFLILLTSCVSMGRISVQVPVQPKRALPNDIQSVVLMNRSMTNGFSDLNQDSLEALFVRKKLHLDEVFLDSAASDTTLKAIGNAMYLSGRFDVVIPVKRNITNFNSSFEDKSPSLNFQQVKQICNEFKVDALLLLENFHEKVKASFQVESGNVDFNSGYLFKAYSAYVQVAYHSNWKLYQPLEKLMMAKFEVNDTIFWERNGTTLQETYEKLPNIKEALIAAAIENGENLAAYISPSWKPEERKYFITNNKEADIAVTHINNNDWKEAEKVWMKFSTTNSAGFRSMIEYNLALASEMNGNLKEAVNWAQKSYQSKYSKAAEDYILLLNKLLTQN